MLSWFKRKKASDDAFQELMITAKKIAWLRAAIISLGVPATEEGDSFASEGALALLSAVTKRTKV
jgi:hypothetical protein